MKRVMDGGRLRALALAAIAAASGCAIAPAGQRAGGWKRPQGPVAAHTTAVAPLPRGPLSLDDLVRYALENHPGVRIAQERLASARAEAPRLRAPDVMTVTLTPAPLPYGPPRPRSRAEALAIEGVAEAERAVIADVKRGYWDLLAIRGEGEAALEDRKAAASVFAAAQARVRAGTAPSRDAERARDALGESESRLQEIELRERGFRDELARSLSAPPGSLPEIEEPPMGLEVASSLPELAPLLDRAVRTAGAEQQERVQRLHAQATRASEEAGRSREGLSARLRGAFDAALRDYRAGKRSYANLDAARRNLSRSRLDDAQAVPALQSTLAALEQAAGASRPAAAPTAPASGPSPTPAPRRIPPMIARSPEPAPRDGNRRVPPAPTTATRRVPIDDDHAPLIIPPISLPPEEPDARPASSGFSSASPPRSVPTDRRVRPTSARDGNYEAPRVELGLPAPPAD